MHSHTGFTVRTRTSTLVSPILVYSNEMILPTTEGSSPPRSARLRILTEKAPRFSGGVFLAELRCPTRQVSERHYQSPSFAAEPRQPTSYEATGVYNSLWVDWLWLWSPCIVPYIPTTTCPDFAFLDVDPHFNTCHDVLATSSPTMVIAKNI